MRVLCDVQSPDIVRRLCMRAVKWAASESLRLRSTKSLQRPSWKRDTLFNNRALAPDLSWEGVTATSVETTRTTSQLVSISACHLTLGQRLPPSTPIELLPDMDPSTRGGLTSSRGLFSRKSYPTEPHPDWSCPHSRALVVERLKKFLRVV